jgi:hypothetical protein
MGYLFSYYFGVYDSNQGGERELGDEFEGMFKGE